MMEAVCLLLLLLERVVEAVVHRLLGEVARRRRLRHTLAPLASLASGRRVSAGCREQSVGRERG